MGRLLLRAILNLAETGSKPPYRLGVVALVATDVLGGNREEVRRYLADVARFQAESDVADILQKVRDKQLLVSLVNEAAAQLGKGVLDVGHLSALLAGREKGTVDVGSIADRIRDGLPDAPEGLRLSSLPKLSEATGGVYGVWVIGGGPGIGKSTLAWQIALDLGRRLPIVYNDSENGFPVIMDRTRSIFQGNLGKIREATKRIFYCENARDLDRHLAVVEPPALIIIDSLQKLPSSVEYRRESLDRWIHRLEMLKKRGYHVLLVSEIPRSMYDNEPSIGAYKETGEIEYAADLGLQLLSDTDDGPVRAFIVKNRHHPKKGYVCSLQRVRSWWWEETDTTWTPTI